MHPWRLFLALMLSLASNGLQASERSEFDEQWNSLQQILGSVYSGQCSLRSTSMDKQGGIKIRIAGEFAFDFRNGSEKFLQENGVVWARSRDVQLLHMPRNVPNNERRLQHVTLNDVGARSVPPTCVPPFADFRILPYAGLGNVRHGDRFTAVKELYRESAWVVSLVERKEDVVQFVLKNTPTAEFLHQILEYMPAELRPQVVELQEKGVAIPVRKLEVLFAFDSQVPGLLRERTTVEISPEGERTVTGGNTTEWCRTGGFWVPRRVLVKGMSLDLSIELDWKAANETFEKDAFSVTGIASLQGMDLVDARLPDRPSLGIIGAPKVDKTYGRSPWFFVVAPVTIAVLWSIYRLFGKSQDAARHS